MFHAKKVSKKYWAITVGVSKFEEGKISIPVGYGRVGPWSRIVLRRDLVEKSFQVCNFSAF
jgi:23S rRNA-/tRNA-specific pseudouridylate synthase